MKTRLSLKSFVNDCGFEIAGYDNKNGFLATISRRTRSKLSKKSSNLPCVSLGDLYNEII